MTATATETRPRATTKRLLPPLVTGQEWALLVLIAALWGLLGAATRACWAPQPGLHGAPRGF